MGAYQEGQESEICELGVELVVLRVTLYENVGGLEVCMRDFVMWQRLVKEYETFGYVFDYGEPCFPV